VWVADRDNHRIRAIAVRGRAVRTVAGPKTLLSPMHSPLHLLEEKPDFRDGEDARFDRPSGIAIDKNNTPIIADVRTPHQPHCHARPAILLRIPSRHCRSTLHGVSCTGLRIGARYCHPILDVFLLAR
jgi:hypothetical protein